MKFTVIEGTGSKTKEIKNVPMKRTLNFENEYWDVGDIIERPDQTGEVTVVSYFEELQREATVCTLEWSGLQIEAQAENVGLIVQAPDMYRLLVQAERYLPKELLQQWKTIQEVLHGEDE